MSEEVRQYYFNKLVGAEKQIEFLKAALVEASKEQERLRQELAKRTNNERPTQ